MKYENSLQIDSEKSFKSYIYWGNMPDLLSLMPDADYFALVDNGAKWFHDKRIQKKITPIVIPFEPSETAKNQKTVDFIHNILFEHNAARNAILLAVGGGVTCDVAGFAASTYKRGIRWLAVPTTLLAQVDASVGGKTAINTRHGKNTIGTFYPPEIVLINHEPIQDLPDELFLEGIAEIVKMFLLFDLKALGPLFNKGRDGYVDIMTKQSVELKVRVVEIDPWENNLRASLNYGHTFGHAIESATGLRHGLAVSQGIRVANRVAYLLGMMKQDVVLKIDELLDMLEFPAIDKKVSIDKLLNYIRQDKKNISTDVRMILVDGENEIGFKAKDPTTSVSNEILAKAYEKTLEESSS